MKPDDADALIQDKLVTRLGDCHARQRWGIETTAEPRVFGGGLNFFHPENWYSFHSIIRYCLMASGFYWRGRHNARNIRIEQNSIVLPHLPHAFEGLRLLHISDLHIDMDPVISDDVIRKVQQVEYDICVMTGDYRARTFGGIQDTMKALGQLREKLNPPIYAVLGNHDSVRMVPGMEQMDIRVLLNETVVIEKHDSRIYLAGIDDAHFFRVDNIEKAAESIPPNETSILLSHTPEIYRQAAHAGFDVMLCGHTHGGQICLPGGIPLTLDANCPRFVGRGPWRYCAMHGYTTRGAGTSIVNVRLNCPPEITIHSLTKG